MLRVLMIAYTRYAYDSRVKRHAQALAARGDHVDVICLENVEQGYRNGVNVIALRQQRYRGSSRLKYLRDYIRFFSKATITALRLGYPHRYDIVLVCSIPDIAVLCALPSKVLGSKVVLDIHDTMPELYRDKFSGRWGAFGARMLEYEERASAWFADRVIAVHEPHQQRLQRSGVRGDKIRVVLNVPDPGVFGASGRQEGDLEDFTIVCQGTVTKRLGLDVVVDAIARLGGRIRGLNLKVVGSGDYLEDLKALVWRRGLDERVGFLAPVPVERLPALICHASLGVVPNLASHATHLMLPVKLLEFAALGIPAMASRLRTIEHYFDDSSVAFFRSGDGADLARVIEELHCDPARRHQLARRASSVLKHMSFERQRASYYDALDSLIERVRGGNAEQKNLDQPRYSAPSSG